MVEIVPVGPFDRQKSPDLSALASYAETFYGVPFRVSDKRLSLEDVCKNRQKKATAVTVGGARCGNEGQLQLECADVFSALLSLRLAKDVLVRVAVTMADLYPVEDGEAWNFVFGQANAFDGVGVFSFSRYAIDPATGEFPIPWRGHPTTKNYGGLAAGQAAAIGRTLRSSDCAGADELEAGRRARIFRRSCAVLTHEVGHLFGMSHCIYYDCLMNGSNSLEESESRQIHLCPVCLRKLHLSVGFIPIERARKLLRVYSELGWERDAAWTESWLTSANGATAP